MAKQNPTSGGKSADAKKATSPDQQAMKAKARQAEEADSDEEEEDDYDHEPGVLEEWIKQSPAMLVSLVVHTILFIILAVATIAVVTKEEEPVISLPPTEDPVIAEEIVPDPPEEQVVGDITNEILEPVPESSEAVETEADDPEAAAPVFDVVETADYAAPVKVGTSTAVAGSGNTGLGSRIGAKRGRGVRRGGGTGGSERAVGAGLRWLAIHQNRDGSWSFNHTPGDGCSGFPNPGTKTTKMGATGLALLAFLGAGHTHNETGQYRKTVHSGIKYLMQHMNKADGRLYEATGESHSHMYSHGIAACAMAEAFGVSNDQELAAAAQLALDYIVNAQGADGGWRYMPKDPGDTSAVGWQLMAFKSGKMSYLTVPKHVYPAASKFLDGVQTAGGAQYSYMINEGHGANPALSAIGLLSRTYLEEWPKDHPGFKGGLSYIGGHGPHATNMYYNYYATMFMFQHDGPAGPAWNKWNLVMREQLIRDQEKKGGKHRIGSWHYGGPITDHEAGMGDVGGRLYNTALATMTLQVYYRYQNKYAGK